MANTTTTNPVKEAHGLVEVEAATLEATAVFTLSVLETAVLSSVAVAVAVSLAPAALTATGAGQGPVVI